MAAMHSRGRRARRHVFGPPKRPYCGILLHWAVMLWRTFLARPATATAWPVRCVARSRRLACPAHWFGFDGWRIRLQQRRLPLDNRLLLVLFLFHLGLGRPLGLGGRIELSAHIHDGPLLFVR